jgi:hypothetical protein
VHIDEITKNTVSRTNLPRSDEYLFETKEFWVEIAEELKELQRIVG